MNDFDFENHMGIGMRTAETIARAERAARIAAEGRAEKAEAERNYERSVNHGDWASQRDNDHLTIKLYEMKARAEAAEAKLAAVEAERDKAREARLRFAPASIYALLTKHATGSREEGTLSIDSDRFARLAREISALTAPAGGERNEGDT